MPHGRSSNSRRNVLNLENAILPRTTTTQKYPVIILWEEQKRIMNLAAPCVGARFPAILRKGMPCARFTARNRSASVTGTALNSNNDYRDRSGGRNAAFRRYRPTACLVRSSSSGTIPGMSGCSSIRSSNPPFPSRPIPLFREFVGGEYQERKTNKTIRKDHFMGGFFGRYFKSDCAARLFYGHRLPLSSWERDGAGIGRCSTRTALRGRFTTSRTRNSAANFIRNYRAPEGRRGLGVTGLRGSAASSSARHLGTYAIVTVGVVAQCR